MIIMYAMLMKMLWNGYGIIIFARCCSMRWVPEVVWWLCMVYLLCFNSLCKREKVEALYTVGGYSGIGYTGSSSGVYSKEGYAYGGQGYSDESGCYSGCYRGYVGAKNDIKGYDKKGAGDENLMIEEHMVDKRVAIKNSWIKVKI